MIHSDEIMCLEIFDCLWLRLYNSYCLDQESVLLEDKDVHVSEEHAQMLSHSFSGKYPLLCERGYRGEPIRGIVST